MLFADPSFHGSLLRVMGLRLSVLRLTGAYLLSTDTPHPARKFARPAVSFALQKILKNFLTKPASCDMLKELPILSRVRRQG
jgi:hypothetical protein